MSRTGHYIAKVPCPIGCGFSFYPGNIDRHTRSCLRIADARRRRALLEQAKAASVGTDPWAPYRVGGAA